MKAINTFKRGIVAIGLLAAVNAAPSKETSLADLVFHNGSIYTLDSVSSKTSALAVKNGIIIFVGSNADAQRHIGKSTKVVNLHGRAAIPGLVDSHMHTLPGGLSLLKCDLNYQPLNIEKVLAHVQGCIDGEPNTADDAWVEVVNLDYPSLVTLSGSVSKIQLDTLKTKRPIYIRASDYHTLLANSRGLSVSNVTASTPDPPGGVVERVSGGNEPSGVLRDNASRLIKVPDPTADQNLQAGRAALQLLRGAGITTFQEASAGEGHRTVFEAIRKEGGLSARAFFDYRIEPPSSVDGVADLVSKTVKIISSLHDNSTIQPVPTLRWQAIKAFVDGVITYPARTAALIEPYWNLVNGSNTTWAPDPKTLIKPYWSSEILTRTLSGLFSNGIDAQLHVDGDLAVRIGLDAAESFRKQHPGHNFRLGLAHDELSHQDDWARFAQLKVDPIMSFQWSQLSSFYIPSTFASLGDYRLRNLQAYAQIEKAGRPVVYGSDWPIDPLDEFLALKVAVTRSGDPQNPNSPASQGPPYDGVFPGEGISREAALRAITINGARFLRADRHIGSLEKHKLADIVVLENNYFQVPEAALGRQRVLLTVVGGEVVYLADGAGEGFEGITAKFPNSNKTSGGLSQRAIGGFDRKDLSKSGKMAAAKLRKRGQCVH
ncbi:amidohydrolase family-domain-containing protein [Phaeosphaeriaceae sp. PMI808]|nr:amidohydrolase family-domain-containing protein [Phaeosphaeriaceae sp. PMI808]